MMANLAFNELKVRLRLTSKYRGFMNGTRKQSQTMDGTKYSKMEQNKFSKGCLPQISFGPFLNTLSRIILLRIEYND